MAASSKTSEAVTCGPEIFTHTWVIQEYNSQDKLELETSWTTTSDLFGEMKWTIKMVPLKKYKTGRAAHFALRWDKEEIGFLFTLSSLSLHGFEDPPPRKTRNPQMNIFKFQPFYPGQQKIRTDPMEVSYDGCNSNVTIYCQVTFPGKSLVSSNRLKQIPECRLSKDLERFLENEKFSDVTLSVDGEDFHAHKLILSARSSVFCAMFDHDMAENQNNRVVITEVRKDVVREMLRYIYSDSVQNIKAVAGELLAVADKYDLERLKFMCAEVICENLSSKNAVEFLIQADLQPAGSLKARVLCFIVNNGKDIFDSTAFKSLEATHPHLACEAFRARFSKLEV